jgi:hypothetical protein
LRDPTDAGESILAQHLGLPTDSNGSTNGNLNTSLRRAEFLLRYVLPQSCAVRSMTIIGNRLFSAL